MAVTDTNSQNISKKTRVFITVEKNSMSATVLIRKPLPEDPPVTVEEIMAEINKKGIVYGIDEEAVNKVVNNQIYNKPIKIAQGEFPKRGHNSEFIYHFDTTQNHTPQIDEDGRIDYKNINFIQNVEKGKVLVTKIPPKPGEPGINIFGKNIKGADGLDFPFKNGANTKVSEDGLSLIATASGAIVYLYEKVSVNDVMVITGDVDFNVGNIDCLGSVRVTGDVKAGFEIKADGDLEVYGNVEDCNIDIKGNIMVKGGFFGKGLGVMKAGGDIYIKFAEGQVIEAKGDIIIGGEVINCSILSYGNVKVKGRKGKIVGGEVKAFKEIKASILGSNAGTMTKLAVAYNVELMNKYNKNIKESERLVNDNERIKKTLYGLYRLQIDGKLSDQQLTVLDQLEQFQKELPENLEKLKQEKEQIEEELKHLEGAKIVVEDTIYPGVRATFGLIYREIVEEHKRCVLTLESSKILFSEFHKEN